MRKLPALFGFVVGHFQNPLDISVKGPDKGILVELGLGGLLKFFRESEPLCLSVPGSVKLFVWATFLSMSLSSGSAVKVWLRTPVNEGLRLI